MRPAFGFGRVAFLAGSADAGRVSGFGRLRWARGDGMTTTVGGPPAPLVVGKRGIVLGDTRLLGGDGLRLRILESAWNRDAVASPSRSRVKAASASARTSSNASAGIASGPRDT